MKKYDGLANRETWLVNLHYGKILKDYANDYINQNPIENLNMSEKFQWEKDCANYLQSVFDEIVSDQYDGLSKFLQDYLDFAVISWFELVQKYFED